MPDPEKDLTVPYTRGGKQEIATLDGDGVMMTIYSMTALAFAATTYFGQGLTLHTMLPIGFCLGIGLYPLGLFVFMYFTDSFVRATNWLRG